VEKSHLNISLSIRRHLVAGAALCLLLVIGIGGWATATNLAGAVVASGMFVVDSYVKKVQPPTGGIVSELLVREGQRVRAGDIILRLDATKTRTNLAIVTKHLDELLSRQARLEAERDDRDQIAYPEPLIARLEDPVVAAAVNSERSLFEFRRNPSLVKKRNFVNVLVNSSMNRAGFAGGSNS
jgi:HlyD family secretion protein